MSAHDPHGGVPNGEGRDDLDNRDGSGRDSAADRAETTPVPPAESEPTPHADPAADDSPATPDAPEPEGTARFWHFARQDPSAPQRPEDTQSRPGQHGHPGPHGQQGPIGGPTPPPGAWTPGTSTPQTFGAVPGGPHPAPGGHGGGQGTPPEAAFGLPAPGPGGQGPRQEQPWGKKKLLTAVAATAVVTSLIVGPAAAVATTYFLDRGSGTAISSLTNGQASSVSTGSVSEVAEKALPSVVSIQAGNAGGSGVVISSDGEILTNNHVVADARGDTVLVQFNDGSEAEAEILGTDSVSDLAVIKAKGKSDLTPATLGDSGKVEVGADVVAIGSPLGLSGTVTSGVVSALDRPVNTGSAGPDRQQPQDPLDPFGFEPPRGEGQPQTSTVINAIQTDAPINPGNSGGPLMNMNGEVIGINTAIASTDQSGEAGSVGLGFAIPINQAKPIAEQLIKEGSASYAAIDATITRTRDGRGAAVVDTAKNGAAADAGLERGDIITSVDGKAVDSPDALIAQIRSLQPGEKVTVGYERDGKSGEAELTLSAQTANGTGS
ncbi:putative serine protease PepD [Nocardiopsis mwathae]|uniref:Putative serine protease PepD n=1 Tax=Nocardiopsis mwathae TaxID=1472723 RepID=A0A7X0D6J1_9ACTN|nr:trypsin-like peptidase domain-containing protein [Nocardiopsis mwathae]MBB6173597.1 putative serine protease PepD [Nocardiopsis mwathae]